VNSCDRSKAFLSISPRRPAVIPSLFFCPTFFSLLHLLLTLTKEATTNFCHQTQRIVCVTLESNHYYDDDPTIHLAKRGTHHLLRFTSRKTTNSFAIEK
jgi:hypothetical protein